ncbi:MAG: OmpH family outer membrane protein [Ferruginibacter sp.]
MKNLIVAIVCVISVFGFTNTTSSQSKIGYISTEELIGVMPEAEKANSELQEYQGALQQQYASYLKELNELDSLFARDSATMSKATKELKRNDMIALYQKVQGWQQNSQQMIGQKQQELLGPIQKKAMDNIKAVAKEGSYNYVFEAGSLLVSPPADDILPLVKKKMGIVEKAAVAPKTGAGATKKP